jgi:hypothetical protein
MGQTVIENPVIDSAFAEPTRHFEFDADGITDEIVEMRRLRMAWIENQLRAVDDQANAGLYRIGIKMATGSGKTGGLGVAVLDGQPSIRCAINREDCSEGGQPLRR